MSKEFEKEDDFKWENAEDLRGDNNDEIKGDYLATSFGVSYWDEDNPCYFVVDSLGQNNSDLCVYREISDIDEYKPIFVMELKVDINTAKKIVENTIKNLTNIEYFKEREIKEHIQQQLFERKQDTSNEIAKKTGYVQGVCESVLAFNTDENRKIMSEDTMSFLSKKILSEMHVTKDMAQKFANPDTYKALEQYVFTPKQEQHLEQTQSQGIGR